MTSKLLIILIIIAGTLVAGCVDSDNQARDVPKIIMGEHFIVEMPAKPSGTWTTDVYRFRDNKTNITCYLTSGGAAINPISCVRQNGD